MNGTKGHPYQAIPLDNEQVRKFNLNQRIPPFLHPSLLVQAEPCAGETRGKKSTEVEKKVVWIILIVLKIVSLDVFDTLVDSVGRDVAWDVLEVLEDELGQLDSSKAVVPIRRIQLNHLSQSNPAPLHSPQIMKIIPNTNKVVGQPDVFLHNQLLFREDLLVFQS